jgi:DNA-binding protein HU-beta
MNKRELIAKLAGDMNVSYKDIEVFLNGLTDSIIQELQNGKEVTLTGFGTFIAKYRHARKGVNPLNPKEKIDMPAVTVPKFKAGKALKDALKKK